MAEMRLGRKTGLKTVLGFEGSREDENRAALWYLQPCGLPGLLWPLKVLSLSLPHRCTGKLKPRDTSYLLKATQHIK